MSTRSRKNKQTKYAKYLVLVVFGLASFIAYTNQYDKPQWMSESSSSDVAKPLSKILNPQELAAPFVQRWDTQYADVNPQNQLIDNDFKKTRYFFDGYNVASNDDIVLPNEETGAGNPKQNYIQDLNDAIVADMVPTGYTTGGSGASGGGVGGIGGGGGGGVGGGDNRAQYVAKEDLEQADNGDNNSNKPTGGNGNVGGSSGSGVSAVPAPPAIWLLSSALIGFLGLRRK